MLHIQKDAPDKLSIALFKALTRSRMMTWLFLRISAVIPKTNKLGKYRNALRAAYDIQRMPAVTVSNPMRVRLAPTSHCNYKCLFCEIHRDNALYPDRVRNTITLDDIRHYESFLSTAYLVNFYGGAIEPLLNQHFGEIATWLKKKYGAKMLVITNGSPLNEKLIDELVDCAFDDILVSYHAAESESYKYFTTGRSERVDANLAYLKQRKKARHASKPTVHFNFALQKLNAHEYGGILEKAQAAEARYVLVSRYYGGRNRLQNEEVCFNYDVETGNDVLDHIYDHAHRNNIRLSPPQPVYWRKEEASVDWNIEDYDTRKPCLLPWVEMHLHPVFDEKDCHYVGVCDRIELFKLSYATVALDSQEKFDRIWNHPLLQYLRGTVNSSNINPVCKLCKNRSGDAMRNLHYEEYAAMHAQAVTKLFTDFRSQCAFQEIAGLEVLDRIPHSPEKHTPASDNM